MVFAACRSPYVAPVQMSPPQHVNYKHVPQYFQTPFMAPAPPLANIREMTNQVKYLEREVRRMSEELKVRADMSKREREARNVLKEECEDLREEVGRLKSILNVRDRQIYELERQLRASQTQLVLLKRRHAAASEAVSAKPSPVPGSISSLPKEMRTIGTQINEINELEERIDRLTDALSIEKERNMRIKSMLVSEDSAVVSVPPLPAQPEPRGRSVPPTCRNRFALQSFTETVVMKRSPRLHRENFLEINCKSITVPPPIMGNRAAQTDAAHLVVRTDSPVMISPIRRVDNSSFAVFEDKASPKPAPAQKRVSPQAGRILTTARSTNKLFIETNNTPGSAENIGQTKKNNPPSQSSTAVPGSSPWITSSIPAIAATRVQPLPFVPTLNLAQISRENERPSSTTTTPMSTNSEAAIKRAVAAAVEKRRQLASHGFNLGSARSSIPGTSSFIGGATPLAAAAPAVKSRFCVLN